MTSYQAIILCEMCFKLWNEAFETIFVFYWLLVVSVLLYFHWQVYIYTANFWNTYVCIFMHFS